MRLLEGNMMNKESQRLIDHSNINDKNTNMVIEGLSLRRAMMISKPPNTKITNRDRLPNRMRILNS